MWNDKSLSLRAGALVLAEDEQIDRFPDSAVKPAPAYDVLEHIRSRPAKKRFSERGGPPRTEAQEQSPLETLLVKGEACGHRSGDFSGFYEEAWKQLGGPSEARCWEASKRTNESFWKAEATYNSHIAQQAAGNTATE